MKLNIVGAGTTKPKWSCIFYTIHKEGTKTQILKATSIYKEAIFQLLTPVWKFPFCGYPRHKGYGSLCGCIPIKYATRSRERGAMRCGVILVCIGWPSFVNLLYTFSTARLAKSHWLCTMNKEAFEYNFSCKRKSFIARH
jgi:hypothetical protein